MNVRDDHNLSSGPDLGPGDAEALDALCEAGFDIESVPSEVRDRARCVARLLGLLDSARVDSARVDSAGVDSARADSAQGKSVPTGPADDSLVHATLARVALVRAVASDAERAPALSPDDEDALELLVCAGFNADRVPAGIRNRARRHAALLKLLDAPVPATGREALVQSTLTHIQGSIDAQQTRLRFDDQPMVSRRFRFGDLVSVAAVLALASSVLIPMAGAMRDMSRRSACQSNMAQAGLGFGMYASDSKDSLPMASASTPGNRWWFVGEKEHSNSANLFTLARVGYTKAQDLSCPGNPDACTDKPAVGQFDWRAFPQVSFSYQNMFSQERPKWVGATTVTILGDRSPIIPLAMQRKNIHPLQNSLQHNERGQSVLNTDGGVIWLRTPVLPNGDNIYLPRPLEELIAKLQRLHDAEPLQGTESPGGADDVFLTP